MDEKERIRILLIDDDEEDYIITKDIISDIEDQEYNMSWVSNFEEAMEEIQKDNYDVFLVDYNLGPNTGIELITKIIEKHKNIPAIMLTGQNSHEIDILAMKQGASDYLIKGKVNAELLERSIRYAIEKKKNETLSNETEIDFSAYIKELIGYLFESYLSPTRTIEFKISAEKMFITINTALSCGLIVNELITNSLKYAFPGSKPGFIEIKFYHNDAGNNVLEVIDNGVGLPAHVNLKEPDTFGLKLVKDLVHRLQGTLEISFEQGTRVKVDFSDKDK